MPEIVFADEVDVREEASFIIRASTKTPECLPAARVRMHVTSEGDPVSMASCRISMKEFTM